jgi:hypothetical protein
MAKRRELPDNWRQEWRKAGPRYDRRESWRDRAWAMVKAILSLF